MATITHQKTNSIIDWTQSDLDAQIAAGNFPAGTTLSDITLASDWNANHNFILGSDENFVNDAQLLVIQNTSGTNTGDQTSIAGITGTKAQFDTALNDGNFLYVGDVTQYTDAMARASLSAGTGISYNSATGEITNSAVIPGALPLGVANRFMTVNSSGTAVEYVYAVNQNLQTVDLPTFAGVTLSGQTANRVAIFDASKNLISADTVTYPNLTELSYVKGVTSPIQAQIDAKGTGTVTAVSVATANGFAGSSSGGATPSLTLSTTVTGILKGNGTAISAATAGTDYVTASSTNTFTNKTFDADGAGNSITNIENADIKAAAAIALDKLAATTASRALVSDVSGFITASAVTATELGYVSGVTSAIQTQLNGKQATGNYITALTGDVTTSGPGSAVATIANNAVTLAKIQTLTTDRLLGRDTAGTGNAEQLTVGGGIEFTGTGGIQTSAFTGDATKAAGGTALTLATVNANVGSFGSGNGIPVITVNAKGLITAVSTTTNTPAISAVTGMGTGVATFLQSPSSAALANAVTDETGTGALVFGTSPTFTTQITTPVVRGSASASGTLTLSSTSNATKGNIIFGSVSAYDEANDRLGLGLTAPQARLHVKSGRIRIDQTDGTSAAAVQEFTNGTDFMYWFLESVASGGKGHIRTDSARAIILQDASTSSGGIGVGGAPSEKLHVYGNILASGDINGANVNVYNHLMNGGFDICQRIQTPSTETAFANNTYTADRWYLMTDGGSSDILCSRQTGDTNSRYAMRLKQSNASAKKWALAQIIESNNCIPLRNKSVRFQARIKSSSTPNMRMAILEWTGTADTLSSARDLINAWANSADANPATTFFKSTTMTVRANIAATATSTSFADFSVTATLGSSFNNLIVVFWTPSAIAQNVTVDIAEAGLYQGTNAKGWYPRFVGQELSLCQRYCYQLWRDNFGRFGFGSADTTSNVVVIGTFPVTMRTTPTLASSTVSNFSSGAAVSSFAVAYTQADAFAFNSTVVGTPLTIGVTYQLTSTANNQFIRFEAEL